MNLIKIPINLPPFGGNFSYEVLGRMSWAKIYSIIDKIKLVAEGYKDEVTFNLNGNSLWGGG